LQHVHFLDFENLPWYRKAHGKLPHPRQHGCLRPYVMGCTLPRDQYHASAVFLNACNSFVM
jgi:hypothetical protein